TPRRLLGEACCDVDVDADEVVADLFRAPGVQPGTQSRVVAVDIDGRERVTRFEDCVVRRLRPGEDGHHPVTEPLDDASPATQYGRLDRFADRAEQRERLV